jgi:YVTN family beta-propeller protein
MGRDLLEGEQQSVTRSSAAAQLALAYAFVPSPNPIRVSLSDAPNIVDLLVIISDPSLTSPTLSEITINIPTGEDSSLSLSMSRDLPRPTPGQAEGWAIETSGSNVTLTPDFGHTVSVTNPIVFTLSGIIVNVKPGRVPIAITEVNPTTHKNVDPRTYSLVKQPADFPVRNFYPSQTSLFDQDQPVTLYWECTTQGQHYAYGLRIVGMVASRAAPRPPSLRTSAARPMASPPLQDCASDGNCYTCADGQRGVVYSPMQLTTTFALDVVTTENGSRSVIHTLETTVQVAAPWISQVSKVVASPTGRFASLHWLAFNARSCAVELEGTPLQRASNAPPDTYLTGYPIYIPVGTQNPTLTVVANAMQGGAQASLNLAPIPTGDRVRFASGAAQAIAITPDQTVALVPNFRTSSVTVLDLASRKVEPRTLPVGNRPTSIAIAPNGATAFVTNGLSNSISIVDVANRNVEPGTLSIRNPVALVITPDGMQLLVITDGSSDAPGNHPSFVTVVDVASHTIESRTIPVGSKPTDIAITPDGAVALVTNAGDQTITVIDIAQRTAEATTLPVGSEPITVAISPDGKTAVVANMLSDSLTIIDVPGRKATATPPTIQLPAAVAFIADGNAVLVGSVENPGLSVLDLGTLTTDTISTTDSVTNICMAPDG